MTTLSLADYIWKVERARNFDMFHVLCPSYTIPQNHTSRNPPPHPPDFRDLGICEKYEGICEKHVGICRKYEGI